MKKKTVGNDSGIPSGIYCYDFLGFDRKERENEDDISDFKVRVKTCIYFKQTEGLKGFCKLKKAPINDLSKICGIDEDID